MLKRINKKASIEDVVFVLAFIFALAIGFIIIKNVVPQITEELKSSSFSDNNATVQAINKTENIVNNSTDYLYLMIFAFLVIGIIISGFMISAHPVFIPIFIVLLGITITLGIMLSNAFSEISEVPSFNDTISDMPFTSAIMDNLPIIIFIVGIIVMVIVFAKLYGGGAPV